jgi:hypothetical protein
LGLRYFGNAPLFETVEVFFTKYGIIMEYYATSAKMLTREKLCKNHTKNTRTKWVFKIN